MAGQFDTPEFAYATKGNIAFPGTQTQATAAEEALEVQLVDRYPAYDAAPEVVAGSIVVAA